MPNNFDLRNLQQALQQVNNERIRKRTKVFNMKNLGNSLPHINQPTSFNFRALRNSLPQMNGNNSSRKRKVPIRKQPARIRKQPKRYANETYNKPRRQTPKRPPPRKQTIKNSSKLLNYNYNKELQKLINQMKQNRIQLLSNHFSQMKLKTI